MAHVGLFVLLYINKNNSNQDSRARLGCVYAHVFDKVSISLGNKYSNIILSRFSFPYGDDSDNTNHIAFYLRSWHP